MSKVIYLPFETLPQRYTEMWNDAFISVMSPEDIIIRGEQKGDDTVIKVGEFLDVFDTIKYKQTQIAAVADAFKSGEIQNGDVFFVPDIFYPALEAIRYMAELSGIDVKIVSFNHAGRADHEDFVQKLKKWADTQEQSWHDQCDAVIVGSNYHAERVNDKFGTVCYPLGAIWSKVWMDSKCADLDFTKEEYCIFPHRPCKEKQFDLFLSIARSNPDMKFVITSCGNNRLQGVELPSNVHYMHNLTKKGYFQVFAHAKYYLSCALQETFGYTVQEAIYFGCEIIVPDHASYPEYVHSDCLVSFDDMDKPNFISHKFKEEGEALKQSRMIDDNAGKFYEICKTLK